MRYRRAFAGFLAILGVASSFHFEGQGARSNSALHKSQVRESFHKHKQLRVIILAMDSLGP